MKIRKSEASHPLKVNDWQIMHAIMILPGIQENSCYAMPFHNIPAMGEGHPFKAEHFLSYKLKIQAVLLKT